LVLNQEDGFRAPGSATRPGPRPRGRAGPLAAREIDLERRSAPRLTVHENEPAALLDDAVHRGQPQPGALAGLLGGEERLEQVGLDLLRHTATRVRERQ